MTTTTAGSSSNTLRSAHVVETTANTTPATPAFKTLHTPALFDDSVTRYSQASLVGRGGPIGDAMLNREAKGSITNAAMTYGVFDQYFESLMQSAWAADTMTDALLTQSFTFENTITAGVAGANSIKRYKGTEVIDGMIKVPAEGAITCDFNLLGRQSFDSDASAIAGATYTAPTNNDPFSATTDFTSIAFAGLTFDDVVDLEISLGYTGKDPQPKITGDTLVGIARGAPNFRLKGKVYVGPNLLALYDLPRQPTNTAFKITVNLGSVTLKKYRLEFWKCYAQFATSDYTAPNAFINFEALATYSTTDNGYLTMTRALA